jgi:carboxyl-terminal processing protease
MTKKIKKISLFAAIIISVAVVIGGTYYLGYIKGNQQTRNITVQGVSNVNQPGTGDFSLFWDAWNILKSKYVFQQATDNNQNLVYGAISGLVSSLKDPYTLFFPPTEANKFNQEISGQFGGIGAEIGLSDSNQIVVIAPLKDTPASRAGIIAGDQILAVNGTSTIGLSVDQAVNQIRGDKGTKVVLTIMRSGWKDSKDFELTRDVIITPTIDFKLINTDGKEDPNGKIAYVRLYNFYEQSPSLFYQAAVKASVSKAQAMIIDLRDNPGGYLDAAVSIGGWFVEKGKKIVTEEFRDKSNNEVSVSTGPSIFKDMPVAVLINKGSASASEILAGALRESNGATIIGEKSFGKGTVQELIPLNDGSMIKVTIAHWLTPNGNQIDKNGITPDIAVTEKDTPTSTSTKSGFDINVFTDNVIQKAVQVIDEKLAK